MIKDHQRSEGEEHSRDASDIQNERAYGKPGANVDGKTKVAENITRLRRFAVRILKSFQKPAQSMGARVESTFAEMIRKLSFRTLLVFDYLRLTQNSTRAVAR